MRGQDGAESPECGIFQVSNCFHSFKLVSSQFQISFKIAVKGELQFLSALFENQESLRFLHFLNRT